MEGAAVDVSDVALFPAKVDGVVLILGAVILVVLVIRRQLLASPRWVGWTLAGIVAAGAVIRALISCNVQMEGVWANARVPLLADLVFGGAILGAISYHTPIYLTEVIFATNLVLAAASPLILFAHAEFLLRDHRCALAAAAILALLPIHIRFSYSDVGLIQSVAGCSFTFVVLYVALTDASRFWRTVGFLVLPVAATAMYRMRQENVVFYVLDLSAIAVVCGRGTPWRRALLAFGLLSIAAVPAFLGTRAYPGSDWSQMALGALPGTAVTFLDPVYNTMVNPCITPPVIVALAIAGALRLLRLGERRRCLFLVGWFVCFFAAQSTVRPYTVAMQARYHLQLVTPLVLLAAAAAPSVWALPRSVRAVIVCLVVSAPLLHLGFERDINYYEMREFEFLTALRAHIPTGCTVLEFQPPRHFGDTPDSRVTRVATVLHNGAVETVWQVVPSGRLDPVSDEEEQVPEALQAISNPPACLMVYQGLTCQSHRPLLLPMAESCAALHRELALFPVAESRFRARGYDMAGLVGRLHDWNGTTISPPGVLEGAEVHLALYRVDGRGPLGR